MAAHRYWALNFTRAGAAGVQIYELEFRATVGGADQSTGKTASADDSVSIFTPDNLIDNSTAGTDYWRSSFGSVGSKVRAWVDFGSGTPVDVAQVLVNSLNANGFSHPEEFDLEYSDDGTTWTLVETFSGIDFDATNPQTFEVAGGGGGPTYEEITYVGGDMPAGATDTSSITLTLPTHAAGDFGVVFAKADNQGTAELAMALTVATGWTQQEVTYTTPGRDKKSYVWTKVFASASETNPVITIDTAEEHSASVSVFRNVDQTTPLDATITKNDGVDTNPPTNPPITTGTDGAAIVLLSSTSGNEIGPSGAPTGYTLGNALAGENHQEQHTAYLLDAGTAGTKTPGAWTHTVIDATAEYHNYTLALRPAEADGGVTPSIGTAAGTSSVSGAGSAIATTIGTAAGTSSVSGVGTSLATAVGTASGSSSVTGQAMSRALRTGTAAGTSTVSGVAGSASVTPSVGTAAGSSTVSGEAFSIAAANAYITAGSTASGQGLATVTRIGSASGSSTASGERFNTPSIGTAAGSSSVSGEGLSISSTTGSVAGTSTVSGVSILPGAADVLFKRIYTPRILIR